MAVTTETQSIVRWRPPGPVAEAFLRDRTFVSGIMGPVGSGKTTAALMKIIRVAAMQTPSPIDGVRRCKALVLRDTFVSLKRTVLPTWNSWFPESEGQWVGGPPAQHRLQFDLGSGPIELIVDFMGIGDDTIENLLRSYEMTCFYINEADLLSFDVLSFLTTRAGRYPSKIHGGAAWYGGWLDFNAPEQDHWLHTLFVEKMIPGETAQPAEGFAFFRQPGGTDPAAENLPNLVPGYYDKQIQTNPDWRVRRMVHNRWGYSRDGKPVYPEFNDDLHFARSKLEPVKGLPIGIGADAGGTPAATFGQWLPGDRWRVLQEIVTGPGTGVTRFGELILQQLATRFPTHDLSQVYGWVDPSAAMGGDDEGGDPAWLTKLRKVTGIRFRPTSTNAPSMRQEALRTKFVRLVEGKPAIEFCPWGCPVLRKALNSGYRYRKMKIAGASGRFDSKPEKNEFSHIAESAEYLLLGGGHGLAGIMGREREASKRLIRADSDYNEFGD